MSRILSPESCSPAYISKKLQNYCRDNPQLVRVSNRYSLCNQSHLDFGDDLSFEEEHKETVCIHLSVIEEATTVDDSSSFLEYEPGDAVRFR